MSVPYEGDSAIAGAPGLKGINTAGGNAVVAQSNSGNAIVATTAAHDNNAVLALNGPPRPKGAFGGHGENSLLKPAKCPLLRSHPCGSYALAFQAIGSRPHVTSADALLFALH
jgi:hypothetical protein